MARARNIKPGFYKNEDLAECSIWARYIFPGLWMLADREGRLEDRPKRIKGELLPFDGQDIEPLLCELAARKDAQGVPFIVRYQNSEGRFIQISKFKTHQTPHYSEKASGIKPPLLQENSCNDEAEKPRELQENSQKTHTIKRGSQPPDSLNPDSLNPDSGNPSKALSGKPDYPPEFERTFAAYPKRAGDNPKRRAFYAWKARIAEGHSAEQIHAGVDRYLAWIRATGKENTETVKHAATFFGPDKPFLELWLPPNGSGLQQGAIEYLNRFKNIEKEIEGDRIKPE